MKDKFFKRFAIAVLGASLTALPSLISGIETGTGTNQTANLYATNSITLRGSVITSWQGLTNSLDAFYIKNASNWSYYVAVSNVNVSDKELTNVAAMTLGGERRTTWPSAGAGGDPTNWSYYAAVSNVNLSNNELTNVAAMTLGDDRRTNWPGGAFQFISKTADETINNITTLQNDDELYFTMKAGKMYIFEFRLLVSNANSATPDWKSSISNSTYSSAYAQISGSEGGGTVFPQMSTTDFTTPGALNNTAVSADANYDFNVWIQGIITDNGSGGTVKLFWAAFTTGAINLTVKKGSYVIVQQVN